MTHKRIIGISTLIVSLYLTISSFRQTNDWTISIVKPIETASSLQIDAIGNIYLVKKDGFLRINPLEQKDSFSTKKYGELFSIDTKFSLKTLCFFKDNNSILIIDDRFGFLSQIRLLQVGIFNASFAKYSSDGMIWVYNSDDQSLYKINENNFVKFKTKNPFIANNTSYNPQYFFDLKNNMIACDTSYGLFLLDTYGNQVLNIPIDSIQNVFMLQEHLIIKKNGQLYWLNERYRVENNWTIEGQEPPFDPKSVDFIQFIHNELWTIDKNKILRRYTK